MYTKKSVLKHIIQKMLKHKNVLEIEKFKAKNGFFSGYLSSKKLGIFLPVSNNFQNKKIPGKNYSVVQAEGATLNTHIDMFQKIKIPLVIYDFFKCLRR